MMRIGSFEFLDCCLLSLAPGLPSGLPIEKIGSLCVNYPRAIPTAERTALVRSSCTDERLARNGGPSAWTMDC